MQDGFQNHWFDIAGVLVTADDPLETCPVCSRSMSVQKTVRRNGLTLSHGSFSVRETVRVCVSRCRHEGSRVVHRPATLACLISPGSVVGYDVMAHVGLERFCTSKRRVSATVRSQGSSAWTKRPFGSVFIFSDGCHVRNLRLLSLKHPASLPSLTPMARLKQEQIRLSSAKMQWRGLFPLRISVCSG